MIGMGGGLGFRPLGHIRRLLVPLSSDPVVLDSGIDSNAALVEVGPDVVEVQVVTDVAVELTVIEIAGIAGDRAPDLARGVRVAPERRHTGRATDGGVDAVSRPLIGPRDTVGFQDRVVDTVLPQDAVNSGIKTALRQPEASRAAAEDLPVMFHAHANLGPHGGWVYGEQGKISVGG